MAKTTEYIITNPQDESAFDTVQSSSVSNQTIIIIAYIASFIISSLILAGVIALLNKKYKHLPTWVYVLLIILSVIIALLIPIVVGLTMLSIHCSSPGADCA